MDRVVRATRSQLEEFKESLIWKDIVDEPNQLGYLALVEYDLVGESRIDDEGHKIVPNTSETLIHLGDIKGRRKAVNCFLQIIDTLIGIIDDNKDNPDQGENEIV